MTNIVLNTCANTDCVKFMEEYDGPPYADLIIADPPFNIKWSYDIYIDEMPTTEFIKWNKRWIIAAQRCLKPTGNLLICMGDEYVSRIDILCQDDPELQLIRKDWMIWHYKFGQSGKLHLRKKFTRSKTHILRFIKNENAYFDAPAVAVPSDRQLLYNDKRADIRGKCPDDVFIYKRIAGTHKDRVTHLTTQMPIELVEVWVKALSPKGGTIFSPFAGSGVDLVAAYRNHRNFIGCELSPDYTRRIHERFTTINSYPPPIHDS